MYKRPRDLVEEYSLSRSMVSKLLQEMLESKRYPVGAIVGGEKRLY